MSRPLELILARQWSSLLSVPILLFDHEGVLVFFIEPAELLLGRKYDETGSMVRPEWQSAFPMEDEAQNPIRHRESPLGVCLADGVPTQGTVFVRGMDGVKRRATITAFPIRGLEHRNSGMLALVHTALVQPVTG